MVLIDLEIVDLRGSSDGTEFLGSVKDHVKDHIEPDPRQIRLHTVEIMSLIVVDRVNDVFLMDPARP